MGQRRERDSTRLTERNTDEIGRLSGHPEHVYVGPVEQGVDKEDVSVESAVRQRRDEGVADRHAPDPRPPGILSLSACACGHLPVLALVRVLRSGGYSRRDPAGWQEKSAADERAIPPISTDHRPTTTTRPLHPPSHHVRVQEPRRPARRSVPLPCPACRLGDVAVRGRLGRALLARSVAREA